MLRTDNKQTKQQNQCWTMSAVRAVALLTFLVVIYAEAFAQQMGQSGNYSDTWVDDSNPANVVIVGSSVTQDQYNSYGHSYWSETTLTSPSGRTSAATSAVSESYQVYTVAETSLPWDWNDLGDYFTDSEHWQCCPYTGNCYPFTETFSTAKAGASHAYYSFSQSVCSCCKYNIVPNCNIRCGPPTLSKPGNPGCAEFVVRLQAWVEVFGVTTCLPGTEEIIETLVAHECFDEVF